MPVVGCQIRRIRHQQVDSTFDKRFQPIAAPDAHRRA
jgi:hypothetical protein